MNRYTAPETLSTYGVVVDGHRVIRLTRPISTRWNETDRALIHAAKALFGPFIVGLLLVGGFFACFSLCAILSELLQ